MGIKIVAFILVLLGLIFRKRLANWARYLYFLRFAILLWFFPLLLVWANTTGARSLVSGIITPSRCAQYLCVAFFLVSSSFVALMLARIVVMNGEERFGHESPPLLSRMLADEKDESLHFQWIAPFAAQLNNLIVFLYMRWNGGREGVDRVQIWKGWAGGAACALLFWYIVNLLYYLTYRPASGASTAEKQIGRAAARTLLFPRSWLLLSRGKHRNGFGDVLEVAELRVSLKWIKYIIQVPGYRWAPHGDLYEAHYLSLLAVLGFLGLYLALWPLTAPVTVYGWSLVAVIGYIAGGVAVAGAVWTGWIQEPTKEALDAMPPKEAQVERDRFIQFKRRLLIWKIVLTVFILGFAAVIPGLYYQTDAERFPILALVLILVISSSWTLAGAAFFADRYRIPVLTAIVVLAVVPRMLHWDEGREEHYLSTTQSQTSFELPTPREILNARNDGRPLIIVTSTGGGIHAAAWTTAVLGQLEKEFASGDKPEVFHDHLLLLSTVSGGSSGLYAYLRELNAAKNNPIPDWDRQADHMETAASCSSLEAVGWGLVYYDIPKAFVPVIPFWMSHSTGVDDLAGTPIFKDRTWALRRAFARNLDDPFCALDPKTGPNIPMSELESVEDSSKASETGLTLTSFQAKDGSSPAISMNTTSVEDGERFLLANYRIPDGVAPEPGPDYKARSFLATFGPKGQNGGPRPDLPLATAAQMSATFPYVSSQARVPLALDSAQNSVHFADGGYYDNDGTSTAIEFLRYALTAKDASDKRLQGKIRVLLIEIRNSDEIAGSDGDGTPDHTYDANGNPDLLWNLFDQAMGPLEGFWNAGHGSGTARDQAGLELLQHAYGPQLEMHAIVFGDTCAKTRAKTDPLNWSLTPVQQKEVIQTSGEDAMQKRYAKAKEWFEAQEGAWENAASIADLFPKTDHNCQ
jgi:hypothetical protein